MVVPYQGPSSDYVVVRMIPDSRLPPRHLHVVRTGKTSAVIKWESPYDAPDQDLVSERARHPASPSCSWRGWRGKGIVMGQESWAVGAQQDDVASPYLCAQRWGPYKRLF